MSMSLVDLLLLLLVAGICGAIGQAISGYSRGGTPRTLTKADRNCSSSEKPQSSAMLVIRSVVSSRRRRAASMRMASTAFAGVRLRVFE